MPAPHLEYYPGKIPVVISAPHGGLLEPGIISFRSGGNQKTDLNTREPAAEIAGVLGSPFFLAAGIKRCKVDFNRPPRAAFDDPVAKIFYDSYHSKLKEYIDFCIGEFGRCFLLDVHGFSRVKHGDYHVILGTGCYRTLAGEDTGNLSHTLLTGGWKVLHKYLGYLSGGYIIRKYARPPVRGVQIEVCRDIRMDSGLRCRFACHLASGLRKIVKI